MTVDLETRLRDAMHQTADRVVVPEDMVAAVDRRVAARRRQAGAARLAVAAVVAVALGVAALAVRDGGREGDPAVTDEEPGLWEPLPDAPIERRLGAGMVWTGEEVIVFGGSNSTEVDGAAAYDPESRTWRELADAPDGLGLVAPVWTGSEVVALSTNPMDWQDGRPGAVYDPAGDSWRPVADAGYPGLGTATLPLWAGDRVVVTGLEVPGQGTVGTAAYDPATDTWTDLPPAPQPIDPPGGVVWTGDELVYVGGEPVDSGPLDTDAFLPRSMVALALDPHTGTWRALPAPPVPAREDMAVAWTGDEVVVVANSGETDSTGPAAHRTTVALDPVSGAWRELPGSPVGVGTAEARPVPVVDGRLVFPTAQDAEHRPLVLDPDGAGRWWYGPPPGATAPAGAWANVAAGDQVLLWGGIDVPESIAGEQPAPPVDGPAGYAFTPDG